MKYSDDQYGMRTLRMHSGTHTLIEINSLLGLKVYLIRWKSCLVQET